MQEFDCRRYQVENRNQRHCNCKYGRNSSCNVCILTYSVSSQKNASDPSNFCSPLRIRTSGQDEEQSRVITKSPWNYSNQIIDRSNSQL